ncbi:MAG: xylulokinase [Chloroflexota bacterium]|jgi:xylulokinase
MALLGIDLGTSAVKALVLTRKGQILGRGIAGYPINQPQAGWAEQSQSAWWQATVTAVRAALANSGGKPWPIAAIGLSGQMHGTVLLDKGGRLLYPAVIWPDRRSQRQVAEISASIGPQKLIQLAGSPLATGFQAATIRWFQQERPEIWRNVAAILTPKDYLRWRLTGEFCSEPSDGSGTLLMDVRKRDWSTELLSALDIERRLLPRIRPSTSVTGRLTEEAANQLGLAAGTPVTGGAADTACGLLGAGVVDEGSLLLTISSGGQLVVPVARVEVDPAGRLHTFCSALEPAEGQPGWYQLAAILAAGLSLRWLRDQVFQVTGDGAYKKMTAQAALAPPGANGLLFLPYLLGERTPHMDPRARSLFLGLTAEHGRPEMIRAVMEGVALACFDAFGALVGVGARPARIIMAGGGARSRLWRQIMADVFNLPVQAVKTEEQAAVGAALLAGAGLGLFDPAPTARTWVGYDDQVAPDPRANAVYSRLLSIFRAAYQKHAADFAELWSI